MFKYTRMLRSRSKVTQNNQIKSESEKKVYSSSLNNNLQLIIVESPSKCKTIQKYIQEDGLLNTISHGIVLATKGHILTLASKPNAVIRENKIDFTWQEKNEDHVKSIVSFAKRSNKIYIATDLDREGEFMAWAVAHNIYKEFPEANIYRVRFNAVTKQILSEAIKNAEPVIQDNNYPNDSKNPLVQACLARYSLDHLYGFTVSPILMRKLKHRPLAAGRVKSPTLGIVFHRDKEIKLFKSEEYYELLLKGKIENLEIILELYSIDGKHIKAQQRFSALEASQFEEEVKNYIQHGNILFFKKESKTVKRSPHAPFITSSLQQAAHSQLGFPIKKTMDIAKILYEGVDIGGQSIGLITYLRTDSIFIEPNTIEEIRNYIQQKYPKEYLPLKTRVYKQKEKNTQEAHEAIRPTDIFLFPEALIGKIDKDCWNLYNLIWKRTIASQMSDHVTERVNCYFKTEDEKLILVYKESYTSFIGYKELYNEEEQPESRICDSFQENKTKIEEIDVKTQQKFTQPPGHLSEATIVKNMEEEGIGRPSTFTNMVNSLFSYMFCEKKGSSVHILPKGVGVYIFLNKFFQEYTTSVFTASMEDSLDKVINQEVDWKALVLDFYGKLKTLAQTIDEKDNLELLEKIQQEFFEFFSIDNICPQCNSSKKLISSPEFFIGCNNYPNCTYVSSVRNPVSNEDPNTSPVIKCSKYGWYVEKTNEQGEIKRSSIPIFVDEKTLDEEKMQFLFKYPYIVGKYKDEDVIIDKTRFFLFVQWKEHKIKIPQKYIWTVCSLENIYDILKGKDVKLQQNINTEENKNGKKREKTKVSRRKSANKDSSEGEENPSKEVSQKIVKKRPGRKPSKQ